MKRQAGQLSDVEYQRERQQILGAAEQDFLTSPLQERTDDSPPAHLPEDARDKEKPGSIPTQLRELERDWAIERKQFAAVTLQGRENEPTRRAGDLVLAILCLVGILMLIGTQTMTVVRQGKHGPSVPATNSDQVHTGGRGILCVGFGIDSAWRISQRTRRYERALAAYRDRQHAMLSQLPDASTAVTNPSRTGTG